MTLHIWKSSSVVLRSAEKEVLEYLQKESSCLFDLHVIEKVIPLISNSSDS